MKLEHFIKPYTKINSKWIKDWNVRPETIKHSRGKHRQHTPRHKSQQDPLDPHPRIMEIKTKINKWDLIKLKSFWTVKETINRMKRQPSDWDKINNKWNNWQKIISRIYK